MRKVLLQTLFISLLLGATAITGLAASEHESHHPGAATAPAATQPQGMMEHGGMGMMGPGAAGGMMPMMGNMMSQGKSGMMGQGMSGMMEMMSGGGMGMMQHQLDHLFYLDRVDALGLSADQVGTLKAIQVACRKDNIRTAAEVKIARIDLNELLAGDNWALKDAEDSVRKLQKLEGDIQVRHLQAIDAARQVLTDQQLKQARADGSNDTIDGLFQ